MEQFASTETTAFCSHCGRKYPADDLLLFRGSHICAECKPAFEQRLREGADVTAQLNYASIWQRIGAVLIDGLIGEVINLTVNTLVAGTPIVTGFGAFTSPLFGLNFVIGVAYYVFFWTQYGATAGKMALGIKIVTAEGGPISVGRAVGRYFALYLDLLTLGIGFLIACFDDQNRTLHDRLCGTRVIRAR